MGYHKYLHNIKMTSNFTARTYIKCKIYKEQKKRNINIQIFIKCTQIFKKTGIKFKKIDIKF